MNRILGSQLSYPAKTTIKSHDHIREGTDLGEEKIAIFRDAVGNNRGPRLSESSLSKKPSKEYSTPSRAQGLHTPGALACTRWQVKKSSRRFYSNRPGARGLLLGTNTRVPEEEELMTINIDSS